MLEKENFALSDFLRRLSKTPKERLNKKETVEFLLNSELSKNGMRVSHFDMKK